MKKQKTSSQNQIGALKMSKKRKCAYTIALSFSVIASVTLAIVFPICYVPKSQELRNMYIAYCKNHPLYEGTFDEWSSDIRTGNFDRIKSYETFYNFVYARASVPPVLSALMSIENGYDTYALISRGKIYSGIDDTHFINLGFDPTKIVEQNFTQEQFENVVNQIKKLNVYGHEHFNIYIACFRGLDAAGLIANSQLTKKQYNVYMIEDGNGTYINDLQGMFINGKTVTSTIDEPYDIFKETLNKTRIELDEVLSKTDNKITDPYFDDDTPNLMKREWALATFDNFNFVLQDRAALKSIFDKTGQYQTKLASVYGFGDAAPEKANVLYKSISDSANKLTVSQKEEYLKLMYGDLYDDTYKTLTRKTLDDGVTEVPDKKLVFIGSRMKDYNQIASDPNNGIGGLTDQQNVPNDYALLDSKYKIDFLFDNEDDYEAFLSVLNNSQYWQGEPTDAQIKEAKRKAFNYMLDYMFNFKLMHKLYGTKYDIIIKGHPTEEIDHPESWSWHFTTDDGYNYDLVMSKLAIDFHDNNTAGKYIGRVPYGTAAENLAYLGADLAIGGLRSSTYTGYDTSVPVEFVIRLNEDADGGIISDPNLSSRYEAGNLFYYDEHGNKKITKFINRGYFFDMMRNQYNPGDEMYIKYDNLRTNWLKSVTQLDNVDGYSIDEQGFWHAPNKI